MDCDLFFVACLLYFVHRRGGGAVTVYVDEAFALNLLIDWLLLKTAVALTGVRRPWYRLLLAALLGAVYAVAVLLPGCAFLALLPLRLLVFALMACVAFGFSKAALKPGLWYLGVCCGFCGLAYALSVLLGKGVLLLGGTVWYAVSFRFLALLAGAAYLVVWLLLPKTGQHNGTQTLSLTLHFGGRSVQITALRDTGNTLRDPISGTPVAVGDAALFRMLLPNVPLSADQLRAPASAMTLLQLLCPAIKPRLLPYRAVGVDTALLLALPCTCTTSEHSKPRPILVAFSPTPVSDGGLYDALIGG